MELWFIATGLAAVLAGISNFYFKVAANQGYNSELFILLSGVCAVPLVGVGFLIFPQPLFDIYSLNILVFVFGFIAAYAGVLKVQSLRCIDSTIYFPLLKLLAPALTIVAGVLLFAESFTLLEWSGLLLGLLIPLMLITPAENVRQNNLSLGLLYVVFTALISAAVAVVNNYAVDSGSSFLVVLAHTVFGVSAGSFALFIQKNGLSKLGVSFNKHFSWSLLKASFLRALFVVLSVGLINYAYSIGGTLAVVQVIYSMYILVTIVLAIIFYNEHWNVQKIVAIILSVAALGLLG